MIRLFSCKSQPHLLSSSNKLSLFRSNMVNNHVWSCLFLVVLYDHSSFMHKLFPSVKLSTLLLYFNLVILMFILDFIWWVLGTNLIKCILNHAIVYAYIFNVGTSQRYSFFLFGNFSYQQFFTNTITIE